MLYWTQLFKRADHNHAPDFAARAANKRGLPLVVYKGLNYYYKTQDELWGKRVIERTKDCSVRVRH